MATKVHSATAHQKETVVGAWSEPRKADEYIIKLVKDHEKDIDAAIKKKYPELLISYLLSLTYRVQVVGGMNYDIVISVNDFGNVEVVVYVSPAGDFRVTQVNILYMHDKKEVIIPGGWSDIKPADKDACAFANYFKEEMEKKLGETFPEFYPLVYRARVSCGIHYAVIINVDKTRTLLAEIYSPNNGCAARLTNVKKFAHNPLYPEACVKPQPMGGWSEFVYASNRVVDMTMSLKKKVEEKTGKTYIEFRPILCRSQVVGGFNFEVLVDAWNSVLSVAFYEPLDVAHKELNLLEVGSWGWNEGEKVSNKEAFEVGGWSLYHNITDDLKKLTIGLKAEAESITKESYTLYKPWYYSYQIVKGTNYKIIVEIPGAKAIIVYIHCPLPCETGKEPHVYKVKPLQKAISIVNQPSEVPESNADGGYSDLIPIDSTVAKIAVDMKPEIEKTSGKTYPMFWPVTYRKQVVNGINYRISVRISEIGFLIATINVSPAPASASTLLSVEEVAANDFGRFGIEKPIDLQVGEIVLKLREDIDHYLYKTFAPVSYQIKSLAGGLYYNVKVRVDRSSYISVIIAQAFYGGESKPQVQSVEDYVPQAIPGGYTTELPITKDITDIVMGLRSDIDAKLGMTQVTFVPVSYWSAVAAGANYMVRIAIDGLLNLLVVVFVDLPCHGGKCHVLSVKLCQTLNCTLSLADST